tara:strand:+ start:71707 stop:72228 length:522 start_codon:yes stop_codon:yes gene_type:complete
MMKLADWLFENNMSPRELRLILGVSKAAMNRYIAGTRTPGREITQRIAELTGGEVQRADFLDPTPPKCATVHTRPDGTKRWVLPWSSGKPKREPLYSSYLSNPLLRAIQVLNGRALFKRSGTFLLDGRVSDPKRIVAAANEVLRSKGQAVIRYPAVAPIHDGEPWDQGGENAE